MGNGSKQNSDVGTFLPVSKKEKIASCLGTECNGKSGVGIIFIKEIVKAFFDIVYFLILMRIIFSFFPVNPYGSPFIYNLVQFIRQLTEPFLAPFRRLVPPFGAGAGGFIDLSPILAIIVLRLVQGFLLRML